MQLGQLKTPALELQALTEKSEPLMYSVDEAAGILKCTPLTIENKLRLGHLPGLKYGRSWVLPARAFVQYLNEQAASEAAEKRAGRAKRHRETLAAAESALQLQALPGRRRKPPPSLDGPYIVLGDLKG